MVLVPEVVESPYWDSIEPYLERAMAQRERNSFKTPLIVEVMPSGKQFRLHYDFTYLWKPHTIPFTIQAGFLTDFASIPRIFRIIIPKLGRWNKASVVHDYIYQTPLIQQTRKQADKIFLAGMTDLGVAKWKRMVMYWAVRIGGWMAWRKR